VFFRGGFAASRTRSRGQRSPSGDAILHASGSAFLLQPHLVSSSNLVVRLLPAMALGFGLGCASTPTPGATPGLPPSRGDTTSAPTVVQPIGTPPASSFLFRDGTYVYDLRQMTVVTVGNDSLTRMDDTLVTTGLLTYTFRGSSDTLMVVGVIDSLSVASTRETGAPLRQLAAPVTIDLRPGAVDSLQVPLDSTAPSPSCDTMEAAARALARDVHVRVPRGVQRGQRWSDSTSTAVCRGGIPMTATTKAIFEARDIQSRGDTSIVQVLRRSTLTLAGAGVQGSRRISVSGTGTSETLFSYELHAGAFLESTGQSTLQLRFETIQQTEEVTQRSTSRVRLRPRSP